MRWTKKARRLVEAEVARWREAGYDERFDEESRECLEGGCEAEARAAGKSRVTANRVAAVMRVALQEEIDAIDARLLAYAIG
jgi:hypothetical protein